MESTIKKILNKFATPPDGYGPIPFWFWNDELKKEELLFQIKEMYDKGIREFLIHARLGLKISYLSEEWFERVAYVLDESEKLGMSVWIYDEENWPSGYAGGKVLEKNPEYSGKYICRIAKEEQSIEDGILIFQDSEWSYYCCDCRYKAAYSNYDYTDMLNKDATRAFINVTHREYYRRFKDKFGILIKGFFVDEPGFYNNFEMYNHMDDHGTYTWTKKFPEYFLEKKGYDIVPKVGLLWNEGSPESIRVRLDYYDVLANMYKENFFDTIREFCEEVGVQLIGHLHCEEFLPYHVKCQGDLMLNMSGMHISGVDRIDLNSEKLTEKYGSSAEHIYNMKRTLSETFAFSGWELTMRQMRQWTNWQFVRGINYMCLHAFFSSIEEERQHDCPPSLFFQNPYWQYFQQYTDYVTRLSWILSQGYFSAPVAVWYPIRTVQQLVRHDSVEKAQQYDKGFIDMCNQLTSAQIDYDIINEDGLKNSTFNEKTLTLNGNKYCSVIVYEPFVMETSSITRLAEYALNGGIVIFVGKYNVINEKGETAEHDVNTIRNSKRFYCLNEFTWNKPYTYVFDAAKVREILTDNGVKNVKLRFQDSKITCLHRILDDTDIYFICNEHNHTVTNTIIFPDDATEVLQLDAKSGNAERIVVYKGNEGLEIPLQLYPYEAVLFMAVHGQDVSDLPYQKERGLEREELRINVVTSISGFGEAIIKDAPLLTWAEYGYPFFSGKIKYEMRINVSPCKDTHYVLKFGKVCHTAEIYVGKQHIKDILWEPYEADITDALVDGENIITVYVTNTLANRLNREPYVSGLLGPIVLCSIKD